MLEKEMNAYRFSKGQEPIDKMMEQIMEEMVQEPRESSKKATDVHYLSPNRNTQSRLSCKYGENRLHLQ